MRIAHHSITWGGVTGHPAGVTSIKDLFYLSAGSVTDAVRQLGAVGYQGTEVFDGNLAALAADPSAEAAFRGALSDTGVELVSVYTGANFIYADALPDELHRITRSCELAASFGAQRLVVGGGARRSTGTLDADYDALAAGLDRVVDLAADHGLEASYHPHLSTICESPQEIDRLMTRTRIGFCPDTGHLAAGGGDPAELVRTYGTRLAHVHLKDVDLATGTWVPLGEGDLDIGGVISAVVETGYDSWLVVELDSTPGDPVDAAAASHLHLTQLLAGSDV